MLRDQRLRVTCSLPRRLFEHNHATRCSFGACLWGVGTFPFLGCAPGPHKDAPARSTSDPGLSA
jgi:hypothetical protein